MRPESSNSPLPTPLDKWFREQPEAERRALEDTWMLAGHGRIELTEADRRRKAAVWTSIQRHMDEVDREDMPRPRLRLVQSHAFRWASAAAVIVLCFGIAYFFRPMTVMAPRGEFAQVQLPDGSLVQLNSESSIRYRAHFLNTRGVRLEGEAYFEVTDSDKRFVVETFNANTVVLGTQFNIRARPHEADAATSVVVAVGKVHLRSKVGDDQGVILTAGQQSHLTSRTHRPTAPESVALARRLAWRTGGLAFSDQPFAVIFDEIERRYDVEIETSEDILAQAFSYYVHEPKSAESVIADLVAAEGLRYRETSQGFEIFRP